MLAVAVAAVVAGCRSFAAIGQWAAEAAAEHLAEFGLTRAGAPDESTLRKLFARIDADALDALDGAVGRWIWTLTRIVDGRRVIALDGKTVRGARTRPDGKAPHLIAAFDHASGAVLGQVAVDAKSNEIPAARTLLAGLELTNVTVTMDAMHTQTETATLITEAGGDYVFTVKANMPTLHEKLKSLPWAEVPATRQTKVVANVVLFVPFGLYIGLLAPSWPWWKVAGAVAGTSLVLEVAQYVLAVGSSDVTDVLVNTTGGLAGIGLLALARRGLRARTTTVMTRVCSIGTVLALLASGIFLASPLRYAPPRGTPQSLSRSVPVQMPGHTRGERPRLKGTPRPS